MGEYRLEQDGIWVETNLPLQTVLGLKIRGGINTHSRLEAEGIIVPEKEA